jgi:hypothetical protein
MDRIGTAEARYQPQYTTLKILPFAFIAAFAAWLTRRICRLPLGHGG